MRWAISASDKSVRRRKRNSRIFVRMDFSAEGLTAGAKLQNMIFRRRRACRVREIAAVLDLSWVHAELAPHYSSIGRPSIDPVLIIRMLIVGYVFAIRSERLLCREVQVNLA